jgi:hypothetical protein
VRISRRPIWRIFGDIALDLDKTNTNCKENLGPAKEDDGENGSGEDLHLIGDLEGGGFQIRGGNKLKIIPDNCSQEASGDI